VRRTSQVIYVLVYPPGEVVGLITAVAVLMGVHVWLGVGTVLALPVVLWLMHLAMRPLRRRSIAEQSGLADAAAHAADLVAGHRVLSGLHAQQRATDRYRLVSRRALVSTLAARRAEAGFEGISAAASQLVGAAVAIAAAVLALTGQITAGGLVAAAGVAVALIGPLDSLVSQLGTLWAQSQASAQRVLAVLGTPWHPAARGTGAADPEPAPALEIVRPRWSPASTVTVDTGEFAVLDPGQAEATALVGALSLTDSAPASGLRVWGRSIDEWDPEELRARLLVVGRDPGILGGTVLDTAADCGPTRATEERARAALAAAQLHAEELADGYETVLSAGGLELSGGQRQRLALARALCADPDILVLEDPTGSLDPVTEHAVVRSLRSLRWGRTTLVLTGSPAFRAHGCTSDPIEHRGGAHE
jgi:putative ABC transport system ATP-binding protein